MCLHWCEVALLNPWAPSNYQIIGVVSALFGGCVQCTVSVLSSDCCRVAWPLFEPPHIGPYGLGSLPNIVIAVFVVGQYTSIVCAILSNFIVFPCVCVFVCLCVCIATFSWVPAQATSQNCAGRECEAPEQLLPEGPLSVSHTLWPKE